MTAITPIAFARQAMIDPADNPCIMENEGELEALRAKVRDLQDRLGTLAGLEERVRVAEARTLDAERRLQELTDHVSASEGVPVQTQPGANDLRARLARTASRKKPGRGEI